MVQLAPPEVPPERNAAVLYVQAFAVLDLLPEHSKNRAADLVSTKKPLTTPELDEARGLLAQSADALRLIREGTTRPECRFPVNYDYKPARTIVLRHMGKDAKPVRLLALSSEVNLAEGKPDAAAEDCLAMLRLARSVHNDPIVFSIFEEIWREADARLRLEAVLERSEPSAETLAKFLPLFADPIGRERLVRGMRAQRCLGIGEFEWIMEHPAQVVSTGMFDTPEPCWAGRISPGAFLWLVRPVIVNDMSTYIDLMNREVALAGMPAREARDQRQAIDDQIEGLSPVTHRISRQFLWKGGSSQFLDCNLAASNCARAAVALRLYRLKHGAYPDTLNALAPELLPDVPKDPFTGANLIYRREGQGFVVYSVGLNGKDDGGVPGPHGFWPGTSKKGDIVWRSSR
jgi:hypothetical protein